MPVFTQHTPPTAAHSGLVDALAAELSGSPAATGEPRIYENEIPQARIIHVLVIWDLWEPMPHRARSGVIFDAYEKVDPARAQLVKFAAGFTYKGGFELVRETEPAGNLRHQ